MSGVKLRNSAADIAHMRKDWREASYFDAADELPGLLADHDTLRTANQRLEGEVTRLREAVLKRLIDAEPHLTEKVHHTCDDASDYRTYYLELYVPTPAKAPEPFEVAAAKWLRIDAALSTANDRCTNLRARAALDSFDWVVGCVCNACSAARARVQA